MTHRKAHQPSRSVARAPKRRSRRTKAKGHRRRERARGESARPTWCSCSSRPVGDEAKSGKSSAMPITTKCSSPCEAMQMRNDVRLMCTEERK